MSTPRYRLPEVDPETLLDFVDASNRLGATTDAVLKSIYNKFPTVDFKLKPASTEPGTLGGVKVGAGFEVAEGLLSLAGADFTLSPATTDALGGVKIGENIEDLGGGAIGLGIGAVNVGKIGTEQLADGSVSGDKIRTSAVSRDKLAEGIYNTLTGAADVWRGARTYKLRGAIRNPNTKEIDSYGNPNDICVIEIGNLKLFLLQYLLTDHNGSYEATSAMLNSRNPYGYTYRDMPIASNDSNSLISAGSIFTEKIKMVVYRWGHDTEGGPYRVFGNWLVTLDGARSEWSAVYTGETGGLEPYVTYTPALVLNSIAGA